MPYSLDEIANAVVKAKEEALFAGIPANDIQVVAAIRAILQLLQPEHGSVIPSSSYNLSHFSDFEVTFPEWASQFSLDNHYDRFLAIAVYLNEQQQKKAVDNGSVLEMYQRARWEKPNNPSDVFAKAAKRMLFVEVKGDIENGSKATQWRMTKTGYDHFLSLRKDTKNG